MDLYFWTAWARSRIGTKSKA